MKLINAFAALLLTVATTALGLVFMGSQEQHAQLIEQRFWGTLGLRFIFASAVGLVGAGLWWGVNSALLKTGFVKEINLRKTAFLLVFSAVSGSLIGIIVFCLS